MQRCPPRTPGALQARGLEFGRLISQATEDRAYKELHRNALTAFYGEVVRKHGACEHQHQPARPRPPSPPWASRSAGRMQGLGGGGTVPSCAALPCACGP